VNFENLIYEQQGAVVRIWLNRPEQRNAQSQQLLQELDDAFTCAAKDDAVHVVVLAGKGDHFSAGHDLKQAQRERANFTVEERWNYEERFYFDYCLRIFDFPKPTIAQVQGACVAGGFMIANMCDLIIASDDAYFSDPVGHTLATAATEVLIHPWVLGLRKAKEMLFAGARLSAQDAHQIGMVNRVVARSELDARTLELAEHIATAPPFGLRLLKRSLNRAIDMQGFRNSLEAHFDTHQLSHVTEEFKQVRDKGLSNAIQKNKAVGQ
jgi:enoyl-CoA hydratase